MKESVKGFVFGVLVTLLLSTASIGYASGNEEYKNIYAGLNGATVYVNGKQMQGETISYNNKTYIPIRETLEASGCAVEWNGDERAVNVFSPVAASEDLIVRDTGCFIRSDNPNIKYSLFDITFPDGSTNRYMPSLLLDDLGIETSMCDSNTVYAKIPTNGGSTSTPPSSSYQFPLHLYSYNGSVYLGKLVTSTLDSDGIWNKYSDYGSKYSDESIWNTYGDYGSEYSNQSAFNEYASEPPMIVDSSGKFFGYLTPNSIKPDGYTIYEIQQYLREKNQ